MKEKNELLAIAGSEFIATPKAADTIREYLKTIRNKYRLQPAKRKALEEALRDVLLSTQTKRSQNVTPARIDKALHIIGDTYEDSSLASRAFSMFVHIFSKVVRTFRFRTSIRTVVSLGLACMSFIFAIAAFMSIARFAHPELNGTAAPGSIETTIGTVLVNPWNVPDKPLPDFPSNIMQHYLLLIVALLATTFFILLARRSKYAKFIILAITIAATTAFVLEDRHTRDVRMYQNTMATFYTNQTDIRTTEDLDQLKACGTQINYVFPGDQSGELFYGLEKEGYTLKKELSNATKYTEPLREEVCTNYHELRQDYDNNQIVLQTYIVDDNGARRPFDGEEAYGPLSTKRNDPERERYILRYGFFVKEQ